jgi:hypothetical protein
MTSKINLKVAKGTLKSNKPAMLLHCVIVTVTIRRNYASKSQLNNTIIEGGKKRKFTERRK